MIEKWLKRLKLLRVSKLAIIICLCLTVIFSAFTIYGNKVGNFVVNVNKSDTKLRLSENEDLSQKTVRLTTKGINEQKDITFDDVNTGIPENISNGIGCKNDVNNGYIAYSFYLINVSDVSLEYVMNISIADVTNNLDSCMRVMIIENENSKWDSDIYAKEEDSEENKQKLLNNTNYSTIDFYSEKVVCNEVYTLKDSGVIKYTIVIWIEGWDADCNDSILQGRFKLGMYFEAVN